MNLWRLFEVKIIKEENELEKRAKFNRKHNKGLGWFVNPDAGDVEYNNAFFDAAMNAAESPSTNPTGPMAENIEEENMKLIKESKQVVKETFDPDVKAKRIAEYRRLAGLSDDDTITELKNSAEVVKKSVHILPTKSKLIYMIFSINTRRKHFRCNFFQVASKVLGKHGGTGQI